MSTKSRDSESAVERFSRESTADLQGLTLERPRVKALTDASGNERRLIRVFVSYVRNDEGARAIELRDKLQQRFQGHLRYEVRFWIDKDLRLDKWDEQIERELNSCDFGLLLISPGFATRPYIAEKELPAFRDHGKPFAAIEFRPVDKAQDNLGDLDAEQFFRLEVKGQPRSYGELLTSAHRSKFVESLYKKLAERFDELWGKSPSGSELRESVGGLRSLDEATEWQSSDEDFRLLVGKMPKHLQRTKAARTHWAAIETLQVPRHGAGLDALDELTNWACDETSPPFCAVLGQYGMGKTTTLKWLTQALLDRRSCGRSAPLPIYVDLSIGTDDVGRVPTLDELLTEHIRRNHKLTQGRIGVGEILKLVRERGALMIFDGLDEKLVHLPPKFARDFVRELWKVLPPVERYRERKENDTSSLGKLLISCRSHFFRNLQEQQGCFLGQDREGLRGGKPSGEMAGGAGSVAIDEGDYRLFVMLPFEEAQVRSYLLSAMGSEDRTIAALALIQRVHNLTELTERPVLLAHLSEHLLDLEQAAARGEKINAAAVYERVVERWFIRDDGKHQLNPEHKRELMQALAAKLQRERRGDLAVDQLEKWLDEFLAAHPVIAGAYTGRSRDVLKEDLRVATFLVRPETGANSHLFRFAHRSLQEFFLARYLLDALAENDVGAWSIPAPSRETLEFLVQMMVRKDEYDCSRIRRTWSKVIEAGGIGAQLGFAAWFIARTIEGPEPDPECVVLDDANLSNVSFFGTRDKPWVLRRASFQRAQLTCTRWRFVELIDANFNCAHLEQAEFDRCVLDGSTFNGALLQGGFVRAGSARGVDLRKAESKGRCSEWMMPAAAMPRISGSASLVEYAQFAGVGRLVLAGTEIDRTSACAFASDGRHVLSGHGDGSLRVWDVVSGRCLLRLTGCDGEVTSCALAPDGSSVLSGSKNRGLLLMDVLTGKCLWEHARLSGEISECCYSGNGRFLLGRSDRGRVVLWDGVKKRCIDLQGVNTVSCFAFSPNSDSIVCGSWGGELGIWNCATGDFVAAFPAQDKAITACFFVNSARSVRSIACDQTIRTWNIAKRRLEGALRLGGPESKKHIVAPNSSVVLTGAEDGGVLLWDLATGQSLRSFSAEDISIAICAIAPHGGTILSRSANGKLLLWDIRTGRCSRTFGRLGAQGSVRKCVLAADESSVVSRALGGELWRWGLASGRSDLLFSGEKFFSYDISPDGQSLLTGGTNGALDLRSLVTGKRIRSFEGHSGIVSACAFSADGSAIVSGAIDCSLRIWDVATGKCRYQRGECGIVTSLDYSHKKNSVLCCFMNGSLGMWNLITGILSSFASEDGAFFKSCCFMPDGVSVLSGASDGTLAILDVTGRRVSHALADQAIAISACATSPSGDIVIAGTRDGRLLLWVVGTKNLRTLDGHTDVVSSCSFSSDGKKFVSSSWDGTVRIWEVNSGICLLTHRYLPDSQFVSFDSIKSTPVAASGDAWRHFHARIDRGGDYPLVLPAEVLTDLWPDTDADAFRDIDH